MITIAVIDLSAQARNTMATEISFLIAGETERDFLFPHVDLRSLSPNELKFTTAPDILIIGSETIRTHLDSVRHLVEQLPSSSVIAWLEDDLDTIATIEVLAKMGVKDTLSAQTTSREFGKKIIFLSKNSQKKKNAKVILVDSGKGGVGVTTLTAALGEVLYDHGHRVLLIDGAVESRGLTRFLRLPQLNNENLSLILQGQRLASAEFVRQAMVQIWDNEPGFFCMPPVVASDTYYEEQTQTARIFLNVLEVASHEVDLIVIDVASVRGILLKALYRVADVILFVVNNDPATLYSCTDKITSMRGVYSAQTSLFVIDNAPLRGNLSAGDLRDVFLEATRLPPSAWISPTIPFCSEGQTWPGSRGTLFSVGRKPVQEALSAVLEQVGLIEAAPEPQQALDESAVNSKGLFSLWTKGSLRKLILPKSKTVKSQVQIPYSPQGEPTYSNHDTLNVVKTSEPPSAPLLKPDCAINTFETETLISRAKVQ